MSTIIDPVAFEAHIAEVLARSPAPRALTMADLRSLKKAPRAGSGPWAKPALEMPPGLSDALDASLARTADAVAKVRAPMEDACRAVMALGYTPADCLIEHHVGELHRSREVLVVRGVPAFELVIRQPVVRQEPDGYTLTLSAEPRVLTWPEPLPSPEPQIPLVGRGE